MRRALAMAGRTLISAGVVLLLFVAYELWGTNISEARSQNNLAQQWQQARHAPARPANPGAASPPTTAPTTTALPGDAIGRIQIPKIGVDKYLVEGVGETDLMKGPGHYPTTPLPGQPGNAAIAGHRTTYGAPFYNLDGLAPGDQILIQTLTGPCAAKACVYKVSQPPFPVAPDDTDVLKPDGGYELTLTTCTPRFSAAQRLIVHASMVNAPAPAAATTPTTQPKTPATIPGDAPVTAETSGSSAAIPDVVGWGLAAGAVWLLAWLLARRIKPRLPWGWPAYFGGAPVFLVFLYFFFENVTRLLPSNI